MKKISVLVLLAMSLTIPSPAPAERKNELSAEPVFEVSSAKDETGKEVYTGTMVNMNGRTATVGFTLTLEGRTSDEQALEYLKVLASEGQDDFLKAIHKNNLGFIAATGQTRRDLLVVREGQVEGKRRIIAAFERWQNFWEVRGGYRSTDYPFSIIEIFFDEKGKGTGTFIGLAQVGMKRDKKTEQLRLEIESFGSFPAKVMGVIRRNK